MWMPVHWPVIMIMVVRRLLMVADVVVRRKMTVMIALWWWWWCDDVNDADEDNDNKHPIQRCVVWIPTPVHLLTFPFTNLPDPRWTEINWIELNWIGSPDAGVEFECSRSLMKTLHKESSRATSRGRGKIDADCKVAGHANVADLSAAPHFSAASR